MVKIKARDCDHTFVRSAWCPMYAASFSNVFLWSWHETQGTGYLAASKSFTEALTAQDSDTKLWPWQQSSWQQQEAHAQDLDAYNVEEDDEPVEDEDGCNHTQHTVRQQSCWHLVAWQLWNIKSGSINTLLMLSYEWIHRAEISCMLSLRKIAKNYCLATADLFEVQNPLCNAIAEIQMLVICCGETWTAVLYKPQICRQNMLYAMYSACLASRPVKSIQFEMQHERMWCMDGTM